MKREPEEETREREREREGEVEEPMLTNCSSEETEFDFEN